MNNMTPRLIERIEKAGRIIKMQRPAEGWPARVWRAYRNARLRMILNDIVIEYERIAGKR